MKVKKKTERGNQEWMSQHLKQKTRGKHKHDKAQHSTTKQICNTVSHQKLGLNLCARNTYQRY